MCCATLITQKTTMATTQLMREVCCDVCWQLQDEQETQRRPVRMNWVVVTDANGNRRLQMAWHADREN